MGRKRQDGVEKKEKNKDGLRREKNERRGLKIEEKDRIGFNKMIGKRRMDGKYFKVGVDIVGKEKEGK